MAARLWLGTLALVVCARVTRGDFPESVRVDRGDPQGPPGLPLGALLLQDLFEDSPFFASADERPARTVHDRPLLVHAGPAADVVFGDLMPDALLQDLARSASFDLEDFEPLMLARGGGLAGPRAPQRSPLRLKRPQFSMESQERFQVTQDEEHFRLRGEVPGYNLTAADSNSEANANPLSVTVVGHALVVSGTRKDGQVTRSFQRSWQLPRNAKVDGINVSFSAGSHTLTVDVPKEAGGTDAGDSEGFEEDRDGSGSTVMFSSMMDSPISVGSLFEEEDPFDTLLNFPMVVQRKDQQPYWRLGGGDSADGKSMIEVVLPKGMVAGQPHDRQLPVHRMPDSSAELTGTKPTKPEAHVDLPVEVEADSCQSGTGVLRCPIDATQVRKMPIVATEL